MTTANVNIKKVLLRRGNTTQNDNYTGVFGEVTVDTEAKTLRIHDGTTVGGTTVSGGGGGGSGPDNVLRANVGAYQIYANANAAAQTVEINSLRSNITAANAAITALQSNAAVQALLLNTLTGNAATQSQALDTLTSNAAAQASTLTALLGNAIAQQTSLIDLFANAAVQAQAIANAAGTYGNSNVTAYLTAVAGNIIPSANVTYSLGSSTRQWKDLWVSNNTIYISSVPLRVSGNTLIVGDQQVASAADLAAANLAIATIETQTYTDANTAAYLAGNVTIGNLTTGGFLTTDLQIVDNIIRLRAGAANDEIHISPDADGWSFLQLPNNGTADQFDTRLHNDAGNVEIGTGNLSTGSATYNWYFRNDGNLVLPTGGAINYANGVSILNGVSSSYGNTEVTAYLVANPQPGTYSDANVESYIGANIGAYQTYANANATTQATGINSINANLGAYQTYANANAAAQTIAIDSITANLGAYQTYANANAAAQTIAIDSITANLGAYQTYANANAVAQSTAIDAKAPAASPVFTGTLTASGNIAAQANVTVTNNMTVLGNLSVQGTTTTVNSTTLTLADKIITVANGSSNNNEANGAGLFVPGSAANILYTSTDDSWTLNKTISGTGNIKAVGWVLGSTFAYANGVNILSDLNSNAAIQATGIDTLNANLGAYQTFANANAAGQTTSINTVNANIGAYQTWANITFATSTYSNTNVEAYIGANIGSYQTFANANAATQAASINSINANVGAYQTFANANAAAQATSITTLTTNAATQQTSINTINANLGAYQAYANATFSVSSYGNSNVAAYLPVYSGNLQAANITTLGTYGNITGANVISANTFVFGANGVNILSAIAFTTANLTNGGNVVALLNNGNLLLPNNMIFTTSPAISTTGIVFGDGKFQNTAYTGPDSVLVNGTHNAALDTTGNLTVPGSILPSTDVAFDLGSPTNRFRHLYVGPGTVYVGNAAIKTTTSGNLILPGVTRPVASLSFVEQVETAGDQSYSFATAPTIIDNAHFSFLNGNPDSLSFTPATYSTTGIDGDGYVRNITVDTAGSGYSGRVAELAEQDMWATEAADPINNFVAGDWTQIPFRAETRAGESEYEFGTGGGTDTGDITFDGYNISSTANVVNITASDYAQLESNNNYVWVDNQGAHIEVNEGGEFVFERVGGVTRLKLPADGDIVDSTGTSVLGGGGNANTGNVVFDGDQLYVSGTGFLDLRNSDNQVELGSNNVGPVIVSVDEGSYRWEFGADGALTFPDNTVQTTAYVPYVPVAPVVQDNLMLDGGGAATVYEITVNYAEGGFSSTRYGVNTPSFNGGSAELTEDIYYTLDGGGA